ncbi:MAG: GNAT family N-acetyltransferase [Candidatus Thorarchaeota archaeon]|nr:MAG: GNAT family N-acetyltransferase [Candidatus Thorarchaeota archaeon]
MSQDSIKIRNAAIDEAKQLTDSCKRAFDSDSEFGAPGPGGPPGYDSVEWNIDKIKNRYLQYYTILIDSDIVGGFIVGDRGPGYQVCERIWVDPDYMRQGIGSRAFELIWDKYPSADLWVLGTPEWNQRTNLFYQKIGFVQIGRTHEHSWDGIYYEKRITERYPKAMSRIGDIHDGRQRIIVEGHVDGIASTRTVTSRKTGEELKVADATLTDDSGSITLVLWGDQIRQVRLDSRIRIEEGYAKSYRDNLQLSIGKWGMMITLNE